MVASSGTRTFLSRIARRTRARRPMSQLSKIIESSTYALEWIRTPRPMMEPRTRPPEQDGAAGNTGIERPGRAASVIENELGGCVE